MPFWTCRLRLSIACPCGVTMAFLGRGLLSGEGTPCRSMIGPGSMPDCFTTFIRAGSSPCVMPQFRRIAPRLLRTRRAVDSRPDPGRGGLAPGGGEGRTGRRRLPRHCRGRRPPRAHLTRSIEERIYARKADRVTVRHRLGEIVAVLEIVSPGNKASKHALRSFVEKSAALIEQGVHVLVIDLFLLSADPQGIHKAIWDEFTDEEYSPPPGKPLTLAAYDAGASRRGLRRTVRRRRRTARHAALPQARVLRPNTAGVDIRDELERRPRTGKTVAGPA